MKKTLAILAILLIGLLTVTGHERPNHRYERPVMVEEWMCNPFDVTIDNVLLSGTTAEHGDYVITESEDLYYFMGKEYNVYNVKYDDPKANIKIGIYRKEYIAYNEDFVLFYECTKHGFGIRRALFNNSEVRDSFCEKEYRKQTILCKGKKINDLTALGLIAVYVPQLK